MDLFLIDAIGPFFRGYRRKRVNWSKIPFTHLTEASPEDWEEIEAELRIFAEKATRQGYNAVTLDDVAHLATHPMHDADVARRVRMFRERFGGYIDWLTRDYGLRVFLTSDVLPLPSCVEACLGNSAADLEAYYRHLVAGVLDDFPQLAGIVMRIGESDGNDVEDPIRTRLHLRDSRETNGFLKRLLPEFEARGRELIFRTWTVGAHRIGDLIWHRDTLEEVLEGIDSPNFIVSMKHGESDFFRYLPLNRAFFRVKQRKLLELQARREYEGAGEYPSFIGWDCEIFAAGLADVDGMAGVSVWCQTGGWHRFHRRAFLEKEGRDIWILLNTAAVISVFKHGEPAQAAVVRMLGSARAEAAIEILRHADKAIREILYIGDFARQKLFFRRVRIPPLFHVYWDCLFINHAVRKVLRHFVGRPSGPAVRMPDVSHAFRRMEEIAGKAELPVEDIRHMADFFNLLILAQSYYFDRFDSATVDAIRDAKRAYKAAWPSERRSRYRIKVSFEPFPLKRRTLGLLVGLLIRRKRGYRLWDRIFTLGLAGMAYRVVRDRHSGKLPPFLRNSAMGVDVIFK